MRPSMVPRVMQEVPSGNAAAMAQTNRAVLFSSLYAFCRADINPLPCGLHIYPPVRHSFFTCKTGLWRMAYIHCLFYGCADFCRAFLQNEITAKGTHFLRPLFLFCIFIWLISLGFNLSDLSLCSYFLNNPAVFVFKNKYTNGEQNTEY